MSALVFLAALTACGDGSHALPDSSMSDAADSTTAADVSTPDALPPCAPGTIQRVLCGMCGEAEQLCGDDGRWQMPGGCMNEGECEAGATESETSELCGEQVRTCSSSCEWGAWEEVAPDGECRPGDMETNPSGCGPNEESHRECQADCSWGVEMCVDPCGTSRRTSPAEAEELCIPSGPFVRGDEMFDDAQPVAEVILSAYYIDRFPVSNARYQQCVDSGVCSLPAYSPGATSLADPTRGNYPVQGLSRPQTIAFCEWDGRRLPTEAEWEKAARGPAPRAQPYPWEGTAFDCTALPAFPCGYTPSVEEIPFAIDGLPGVRSYYGVDLMVGGGLDRVSDVYGASYYSDPASLMDPTGPTTFGEFMVRGSPRSGAIEAYFHVSRRQVDPHLEQFFTVRCARSGEVR